MKQPERKKVYVSGPITNGGSLDTLNQADDHAIDAFVFEGIKAAQSLAEAGFAVFCPHLSVYWERVTGKPLGGSVWMENDLPWVRVADAVLRLSGASAGADTEVAAARAAGVPVFETIGDLILHFDKQEHSIDVHPGPCQQAQALVYGARGKDYGNPWTDFSKTAQAWSALFGWDVTPEKVAMAMICVKLSRLVQSPHHKDSVVDLAGYAETLHLVQERREELNAGT